MNTPQIKTRLEQLTPEYRAFIGSGLPEEISRTFAEYYNLTPERAVALENAIILLLIFVLNEEQFINFVALECTIDPEESRLLYHGIVLALPETIEQMFQSTTQALSTSTNPNLLSLEQEITSTQEAIKTIPQVRTMAPITPEETVYTSTQAAILHEGQSADQKQTSSARWESES